MTVTYKGKYDTDKDLDITDESLDLLSRTGVTNSAADVICGRGYTTCAPKGLCWACDAQVVNAKARGPCPAYTM